MATISARWASEKFPVMLTDNRDSGVDGFGVFRFISFADLMLFRVMRYLDLLRRKKKQLKSLPQRTELEVLGYESTQSQLVEL